MGLIKEVEPELLARACISANDFDQLKAQLKRTGWAEAPYFYNLAKGNGHAADIQKEGNRELVYCAPVNDLSAYSLLEKYEIPRFPILKRHGVPKPQSQPETDSDTLVPTVVELPEGTRPLNWMRLPEQQAVTGHIGAIEMMSGVGKLLANIYKKTNLVPKDIKMSKLAFVPFSKDYIRLVPPIELEPAKSWLVLKERLLADLNLLDPATNHASQVEAFEKAFAEVMLHG